jgi:cysteine-rich repeat protein
MPPTANDGINSAGGIPGPGAISLRSLIEVCRCGDGKIGCDEQCDDGDLANGDGCNESCQEE